MRILLITYYFPPYNVIGALRLGKTAKYLHEAGHDLRVVAARDRIYPASLPLEIPDDYVVYTDWADVNRFGVAMESKVTQKVENQANNSPSFVGRLLGIARTGYLSLLNIPDERVGWIPYAIKAGVRLCREWQPDVIYSSGPPHSAHLAAALISAKSSVPFVAELRDPWLDNQDYRFPYWRKSIDGWLERRVLKKASALVTVSEPWAETFRKRYGMPTAVIPNGYDPADYPAAQPGRHRADYLRLVYTGSVYAGKQDPEPLFAAIRLLGLNGEKIRVAYFGHDGKTFADAAQSYGLENRLELHPSITHRQALQEQVDADVLLLLLCNDVGERGWYPAKLFEYLGARRPILAIGPTGDVASQLIEERGAGVVLLQPEEICKQLRGWLELKANAGIRLLPESVCFGLTRGERVNSLVEFLTDTNH